MTDKDPLEYLSEEEAATIMLALRAIELSIRDKDLRETLLAAIYVEIEDWGQAKALSETPTHRPN